MTKRGPAMLVVSRFLHGVVATFIFLRAQASITCHGEPVLADRYSTSESGGTVAILTDIDRCRFVQHESAVG